MERGKEDAQAVRAFGGCDPNDLAPHARLLARSRELQNYFQRRPDGKASPVSMRAPRRDSDFSCATKEDSPRRTRTGTSTSPRGAPRRSVELIFSQPAAPSHSSRVRPSLALTSCRVRSADGPL